MDYMQKYNYWLKDDYFDEAVKKELEEIEDDPEEIKERFYKDLEFGTGGMRGIIGAGTNRINDYIVRKATQGFANYIKKTGRQNCKRGVVIAYDSRYKSREFAIQAALVLNGNDIKSYIFEDISPVPELSFAVRELNAVAGIVITASHNPPQYNGYKVYWEDGGQLVPTMANQVIDEIAKIDNFEKVNMIQEEQAKEKGLFNYIGSEIDDRYIERIKKIRLNHNKTGHRTKIVYTPLHGTGRKLVMRALKEIGFDNVYIVPEQQQPDHNFSTVKYPNPEEPDAFRLAIPIAKQKQADIILATDPDCDRMGMAVLDKSGDYKLLNGNQTGALLIDYILSSMKLKGCLPNNGVVIKTIVTSELGREIASSYGVETIDTLTGFKFIGEKINQFEQTGEKKFIFGYEESYGYLAGTHARDKDGVVASMLAAEMTAYYKSLGMTVYQALKSIYQKYGYYMEELESVELKGIEGQEKLDKIMDGLRKDAPKELNGVKVKEIRDYLVGIKYDLIEEKRYDITLPVSNVLYFALQDYSWVCIRPSGTEPKVKIYFSVKGEDANQARDKILGLKKSIMKYIK
ncbi:MAG: phospho-sugar mutase [Clostridia bacterium]|nr:phospho-sugar mutase [Clostridia bacterium]